MLLNVSSFDYEIKPIRFTYLNEDREFIGRFSEVSSNGEAEFHSELSAVWDFNQNFDSVNILTENRKLLSENVPDSYLSVFQEDVFNMNPISPVPYFNYWLSFPMEMLDEEDEFTKIVGNIIPLKNNFTPNELVHCGSNIREYLKLNFGEKGFDSFKPEFLFGTRKEILYSEEDSFVFRIPDYSENLNLSSFDFACYGSTYGDSPENADWIEAKDGLRTWLSGDEDGNLIWVDRYFGQYYDSLSGDGGESLSASPYADPSGDPYYYISNNLTSFYYAPTVAVSAENIDEFLGVFTEFGSIAYVDVAPSVLELVSGEDYIYHRANTEEDFEINTDVMIDENCDYSGCFVFMSDSGLNNNLQLDAAELIYEMGELDGLFFGGNTNYPDGALSSIEDNWDVWDPYIDLEKVYPAIGPQEISIDPLATPHVNKFNYLPHKERYYNIFFEDAGLELFVLNSGVDPEGNMVEPDGNSVDSVQYNWFIDKLEKSTAKYRVVMFHHPYVTSLPDNSLDVVSSMDWGFDELPVDLILNGGTRTNQHLRHNGLDIVDVSTPVFALSDTSCDGVLFGETDGVTLEWVDGYPCEKSARSIAKLISTPSSLTVQIIEIPTNNIYKIINIRNTRNNICS